MLVILAVILAAPIVALAITTRRRPLVVRETPVISYLPRDIAIATCWRRNRRR